MAETELWLVDLGKTAAALEAIEAATPRLSDDIRHRLHEMSDEAARRERRLAHIALRILLEKRLGPCIRRTPFVRSAPGKLSLAGSDVAISLAHTEGVALIALGDGDPLGVDIEHLRPVRIPEERREPIEREAVALAQDAPLAGRDRDARFLNAWVRIEAAAKAEGSGVGPLLERLRPGRRAPLARPLVVHDVPVSADVFAAVAMAPGRSLPPLCLLPETTAAIDALLEADEGTSR
ncbi:phosphopantetheinyl transferase [Hyphomicrobium sp.]|uniref:4'-phosphopantetheinyl transferase family protein n=1 Tax=Hyphomicrobium sp. TaxID=82 RepID=UPI0025C00AE8|nr:phosphopantetheinyl transferase [Hyphomicrobium sp.]MCC7250810.1 phosphopantetheinyl transferase [Hyphomicrobium sp.]